MNRTVLGANGPAVFEEINGIVAVRGKADKEPRIDLAELRVRKEEASSFALSGWTCVRAASGGRPRGKAPVWGTVLRHGRHLFVASNRVVVQFREWVREVRARTLLRKLRLPRPEHHGLPRTFQIRLQGQRSLDVAERLQGLPEVEFAEPVILQHFRGRSDPTSEPLYEDESQWQWPKIGADHAWKITQGQGAVIAVIDHDFMLDHYDLEDGLSPRSAVRGGNGAWSTNPISFPDPHSHGTACAGMAAARVNDQGGCGISPEATLLLLALGTYISQNALAAALLYAAGPILGLSPAGWRPQAWPFQHQDSAHVASISIAPASFNNWLSDDLKKTLALLRDAPLMGKRGLPVFYAVSNDAQAKVASDLISATGLVINVGQTDKQDGAGDHATGAQLDLVAPGKNVCTTIVEYVGGNGGNVIQANYGQTTGTSNAAPCAAGVAALVRAANPGLTGLQTLALLRATCKKIGREPYVPAWSPFGRNDVCGYGRVDAGRAVMLAHALL